MRLAAGLPASRTDWRSPATTCPQRHFLVFPARFREPYTRVKNTSFTGDVNIRWYADGTLNACQNCVDRHLPARADQAAILWEGDSPNEQKAITYLELHEQVLRRLANALKAHGVKKGDRVTIYLP